MSTTSVLKQDEGGRNIVERRYSFPLTELRASSVDRGYEAKIAAPDIAALEVGHKELGEKIALLKATQEVSK